MQPDTFIGREIAGFVVQERLSFGTRSSVYRAYQPTLNRDVALKITRLDRRIGQDAAFRQRFEQAAAQIMALSQQNVHIVPIYAYGLQPGLAYVAMRLTPTTTLAATLASRQPTEADDPTGFLSRLMRSRESLQEMTLPLEEVIALVTQIGRALGDAHRQGIVHYDLQAENILLDETGNAHLTDFGLMRRVLQKDGQPISEGDNLAALLYASPEQIHGQPLTPRSDVYALGTLLYELAVGRLPVEPESDDLAGAVRLHAVAAPPLPHVLNPNVPPFVEAVILKALEKDPSARYSSINAMIDELNAGLSTFFDALPLTTVPTNGSLPDAVAAPDVPSGQQADMQPWLPVLSTTIIVVMAVVGIWVAVTTPFQREIIVLEDRFASAEEIVPSNRLVRAAQARLGEDGYIAYVACGTQTEADEQQRALVQQVSERYNLRLEITTGRGDTRLEARAAERAIEDGAVGLIHCAVGPRTVGRTLTEIAEQDVPVIVNSRAPVEGFMGGVYVSNNDYGLGVAAGEAAGAHIQAELGGSGRVLLVDDPRLRGSEDVLSLRAQGLRDGVLAAAPDAIILEEYAAQSLTIAQTVVRQATADELRFNVVLTASDDVAYGIVRELEFAGYLPADVAVFSIDGEASARELIANGQYLHASANPNYAAVAQASFDTLVLMLAGEAVPARVLPQDADVITQENAAPDG